MSETNGQRRCGCGCGETLHGGPRQRFASDACRKRAARNGRPDPDTYPDIADADADIYPDTDTPPPVEAGRCRAGLESWLDGRETSLASSLVEAARALADELDADPSSSPLWGRYSTLLGQLTEHHLDVDLYGLRRTEQAVAYVHGGQVRCAGCERVVHSCPYCRKGDGDGLRFGWAEPVHPDDAYPALNQ